jgi:hypothetical protein
MVRRSKGDLSRNIPIGKSTIMPTDWAKLSEIEDLALRKLR